MTYEERINKQTEMKMLAGKAMRSLTNGITGYTAPRDKTSTQYARVDKTTRQR